MPDIDELEKRWLKYKIKTYIPHAIIVIILIFIGIYFLAPKDMPKEQLKTPPKVEKPKKIVEKKLKKVVEKKTIVKKIILKPSLDFMLKIKKIKQKNIVVETPKVEVVSTKQIYIKRKNVDANLDHVIKRFQNSNNPALSLFLAKKFYELKDYEQSYNYALATNEIDEDIDESWIIFSKSLVKLNKKKRAIEVLERYVAQSKSKRANTLLQNIKSGKMR